MSAQSSVENIPPTVPQTSGGAKTKRPKASKKKPNPAKKDLLFRTVGESLASQLFSHSKLDNTCTCCALAADHQRDQGFLLPPAAHPTHDARSRRCGSSCCGSSSSSQTLVEPTSDSDALSSRYSSNTYGRSSSESSLPLGRAGFVPLSTSTSLPQINLPDRDQMDNAEVLERLAGRYGKVSHMVILDRSYNFFLNKARTGALCYKVQNQVAIVAGDPLCEPYLFSDILDEFKAYRKQFHWGIAFMGASDSLVKHARQQRWTTLQFGAERVLNPMTNDVLMERSGKRIIVQNKQLLNPDKGGITLGAYAPANGADPSLQSELMGIYESWRHQRNQAAATAQAFITVYNPFDFPNLMIYIYTRGPDGVANGFAALRRVGANEGYHLDPCIAAPGAPKGISDLLAYAAMALLNHMNISYLSLGYEPLTILGDVTGLPSAIEKITRSLYRHTFQRLPIGGKKAYHDKFRPDPFLDSELYLVFPSGVPGLRHMLAMVHMANISIRKLVRSEAKSASHKESPGEDR
ncbi:hypothetical protein BDV24DRAFT_131830 [Aspergillus arachidicola]|uniref:Phosphatidylglycerol lysyltransferase C-terminal domain-containing protein n=1 Tax=Aspergillus arachidicola TaxID=656916 RepID=A0A2G7G9V3_9EURO|nr:hypothetical protein BDV24DRAFT_131830 [Aspergillus arachidicola]PIG88831.1 hypothetical protein AARAC_007017 [Aspergillus arachidicola]